MTMPLPNGLGSAKTTRDSNSQTAVSNARSREVPPAKSAAQDCDPMVILIALAFQAQFHQ
jgi:hypothetical protein